VFGGEVRRDRGSECDPGAQPSDWAEDRQARSLEGSLPGIDEIACGERRRVDGTCQDQSPSLSRESWSFAGRRLDRRHWSDR
jgi:hypothetical protein